MAENHLKVEKAVVFSGEAQVKHDYMLLLFAVLLIQTMAAQSDSATL